MLKPGPRCAVLSRMDFNAKYDRPPGRTEPNAAAVQRAVSRLWRPVTRLERLSGGYANTVYRAHAGGGTAIIRLVHKGATAAQTEAAVLERVAGVVPAPRVLTADWASPETGGAIVLLEDLAGLPLAVIEDHLSPEEVTRIGWDLGASLAALHEVRFDGCGFFAPDLRFAQRLEPFRQSWLDYMRDCLNTERVRARLGAGRHQRLTELVEAGAAVLAVLRPLGCLVHSDFNQKNLLVAEQNGRWRLSGIVDWEFAHAGAGVTDFGNLLRFEPDQPPYRSGLIQSYRAAGGDPGTDWARQARFLDLAAMLSFLAAPDDRPRTIRTACTVIDRTLTDWPKLTPSN